MKRLQKKRPVRERVTFTLSPGVRRQVDRTAARVKPAFMAGFGKLRHLRAETRRIQRRIDRAFEVIEPEDRA